MQQDARVGCRIERPQGSIRDEEWPVRRERQSLERLRIVDEDEARHVPPEGECDFTSACQHLKGNVAEFPRDVLGNDDDFARNHTRPRSRRMRTRVSATRLPWPRAICAL